MVGELLLILWITLSCVHVLHFVILKAALCKIANRIKCCTKIHTKLVFSFSIIVLKIVQGYFLCPTSFIHKQNPMSKLVEYKMNTCTS